MPRGFCFQPIDVADLATRLVDCVDAGPAGRLADLGGPQALPVTELAASTCTRPAGAAR